MNKMIIFYDLITNRSCMLFYENMDGFDTYINLSNIADQSATN